MPKFLAVGHPLQLCYSLLSFNKPREAIMTTQYGRAAVKATELLTAGKHESPEDAWNEAIKCFTQSWNSQQKGCPKGAYLGLCKAGLVKGVAPEGSADDINMNGVYVIKIVLAIKANPKLANATQAELWKYAETDAGENGQVGVVLALWENGLIV